MLVAKIQRVPSRPNYPQASFVIDFLDDSSPQSRPLNYRVPVSWEGLHALQEALEVILNRDSDVGTGQEKPVKTHEFTVAKNQSKEVQ